MTGCRGLRWVSLNHWDPRLAQPPGSQPGPEVPDDHCCHIHCPRPDPARQQFAWVRQLGQTAGDLLPTGDSILTLYQCPRLYDAATGDLQAEWTSLPTGQADSSIVGGKALSGPARVAIDERHQRFAVAGEDRITVIQLG